MHTRFELRSQRSLSAAIFAALALAAGCRAQVGLGLAPMRVELKMDAGAQFSGSLILTNDSGRKVRVRAELLDFYIDSAQTPQFEQFVAQEAGFSCHDWISVNPMESDVTAGGNLPIRFTIRVPQTATSRSYHCAAGFTTLPTAGEAGDTGIKTAVRIVSAFYVVVGQPAVEGGFKEISLKREPGLPGWVGEVVMENFSNMHFRPVGNLELLDERGAVIEAEAFTPFPVLPKREQRFLIPFKTEIPPGKYTLRARVDIGAREIQEGTAVVTASR